MATNSSAVRASREMPIAMAVCVAAPSELKAMLPSAYSGSRLTSEPTAGRWLLSRGQEGAYGEEAWDQEAQIEEEEEEVDELMASWKVTLATPPAFHASHS